MLLGMTVGLSKPLRSRTDVNQAAIEFPTQKSRGLFNIHSLFCRCLSLGACTRVTALQIAVVVGQESSQLCFHNVRL